MQLWQAVILGLVEGITEYLPVSSTGHLILARNAIGLTAPGTGAAVDAYLVVMQSGAILAVVGLYFPRFLQMLRGLAGRDRGGLRLLVNIGIAFTPAAAIGFLLNDAIKRHLFQPMTVAWALVLGGIYMILLDRWKRRRDQEEAGGEDRERRNGRDLEELTQRQALIVGLLQCAALWPGMSRSMMTISGGYIAGLTPRAAAEFSFLLGVPVLLAAAGYDLVKDLMRSRQTGEPVFYEVLGPVPTAVGLIVATLSAAAAVRWLVGFLGRHGLTPFGWYRIVVGVMFLTLVYAGRVVVAPV